MVLEPGDTVDDPRRTTDLLRILDHELSPDALVTPGPALGALGRALVTGRGRRAEPLREARTLVVAEARHAPSAPVPSRRSARHRKSVASGGHHRPT